ncbi:MAG: hypothetical protein AB2L20_15045 [Mangrovibacterium sp.]
MEVPAGIIPNDLNTELLGVPGKIGKLYYTRDGNTKLFPGLREEDLRYWNILEKELECDIKAIQALRKMGVPEPEALEHYNWCNRSNLDGIADIRTTGKLTHEFVDCSRRGKCIGEGKVCKPLMVNGEKITYREREALSHLFAAKKDKQIQQDMGFSSPASVKSLMVRLRGKFDASSRSELLIKARQIGIV